MKEDTMRFFTEHYTELTDSEKQIADYIIANLNEVIYMNVHTLAERAQVSVATIVRFSQHLGFDGYRTFKLFLAKCNGDHEDYILDIKKEPNITVNQVQKVLNAEMNSIRLTLEGIDYTVLEKVALQIKSAKNLLFCGTGTSNIVGNDACLKFQRTGKFSFCACDLHTAVLYMSSFTTDDLVIGISHSGQNETVCKVMETAGQTKIPTVAITTFPGSRICSCADSILYTQTRESPFHKVAITSRISQFAVMDALFMAYVAIDRDSSLEHVNRLSEFLDMVGLL